MKSRNSDVVKQDCAAVATTIARAEAVPGIKAVETADTAGSVHPMIKEQLSIAPEFQADMVVIGSGPAGYVAAIRAAQLGARTVIVEKNSVGGTCLNVGCIPTKVLLGSVGILDKVRNAAEFGINAKLTVIDFAKMMARKDAIVKQLTGGVEALFRKNKIRLVCGAGKITDPNTVIVDTSEGEQTIKARHILIATGSEPAQLPLPGLELGDKVWSSTEALTFDAAPKSLLVIGAGAIGLESGYMFARLGTDVTVVEMMPQILPAADTEVAGYLQKGLESAGMTFMLNAGVTRAEDTKAGKRVYIKTESGEEAREFERVLVAVGRKAVTKGIGLDEVGIKQDRGRIIVTCTLQTNIPASTRPATASAGDARSRGVDEEYCRCRTRDGKMDAKMCYKAFPACVYPSRVRIGRSHGETGRASTIETSASASSRSTTTARPRASARPRFCQVYHEPKYGQITRGSMVGPEVTDLSPQRRLR